MECECDTLTGVIHMRYSPHFYSTAPFRHLAYAVLIAFDAFGAGLPLAKLLRTEGTIRRRNKMGVTLGLTASQHIT